MTDFTLFSKAVHARFNELSQAQQLFLSPLAGDALWDAYLAAFPEGSNPIFRERTEHDCSCCRNFIKNIGGVVAIIDGYVQSVWGDLDTDLPHPYNVVAERLAELIETHEQPIASIYRTTPNLVQFGAEKTIEEGKYPGTGSTTWHHFHGRVPQKFVVDSPASAMGEYNTSVQMFKRALGMAKDPETGLQLPGISAEAVATVLALIADNNLYRGEEKKHLVLDFQEVALRLASCVMQEREVVIALNANRPMARIRNDVIGTLLVDLSEGVPLEKAVKSFEDKVSGTNYKRPKALITQAMVDDAMKTIEELEIETSLNRRHAHMGDLTINNVLWADRAASQRMKGGLAGLLSSAVKEVPDNTPAEDISIADFMANVVPNADSMDVYLTGAHQGSLVSLTAPVDEDSIGIFKWNNNFGWSYNGNIADSEIRRKVQAAGGRVDGVLRFSHSWNHEGARNASLMDLHVFMPGCNHKSGQHDNYDDGRRVGWNRRNDAFSGGKQDVDFTSEAPLGYVPVENITFPDLSRLQDGEYHCKIHNWKLRSPNQGGFKAEIEFGGQVFEYSYDKPLANKEWVDVATITLKNGVFSIVHHLPAKSSSVDVWGVKTESYTPVEALMFSPNYWDEQTVGNKHHFFILKGCRNPEPVRGIYNEFLMPELDKHRKVFEVLGSKTMCPVADEQLSGVGFSSTKKDVVRVRVSGPKMRKVFNVKF